MIRTFLNWLKLDAQNLITEVWWAVLILWCLLIVIAILDIATNTLTRGSKASWIAATIFIPFIGLFTYCLFCLTRVDYHLLEFVIRKPRSARRKGPRASAS